MEQSKNFPVFEHFSDIVNTTLCAKEETRSYHSRECLNRECESCDVDKLDLMKEDVSPQAPTVNWQKFEYVTVGQTQEGKEKKGCNWLEKILVLVLCLTSLRCCCMNFPPTSFVETGNASR